MKVALAAVEVPWNVVLPPGDAADCAAVVDDRSIVGGRGVVERGAAADSPGLTLPLLVIVTLLPAVALFLKFIAPASAG